MGEQVTNRPQQAVGRLAQERLLPEVFKDGLLSAWWALPLERRPLGAAWSFLLLVLSLPPPQLWLRVLRAKVGEQRP